MKIYYILKQPIFILSSLGCIISSYLVISDIMHPNFCPIFITIPACYLTLAAYTSLAISEFINKKFEYFLFIFGFLLGILLAIWFSYYQIMNLLQCPLLFNIPLCYLSFILLVTIIILKILFYFSSNHKKAKRNNK
jgi:hypothetical protein